MRKFIGVAVMLVSSLLPQTLSAGTIYVLNAFDSGSGSLRQAITNSNATSTNNTISWVTGAGGTISLSASLDSILRSTTLDVTAATTSVKIANYYMPVSGAVTLYNDNVSNGFTVASVISGAGSITKAGDGDLTLSNNNTYTGGTSIDDGRLLIYSDSALGDASGGLAFNGGTLWIGNTISSARTITLNAGGGTIDTNSCNLYLSGSIGGTGSLTKKGVGTLQLSGTNTYTGSTIISEGTVQLGANNGISTQSAVSVAAAGAIDMGAYTQTMASYGNNGTLGLLLQNGVTNLTVTNTATLAGALNISLSPQLYTAGQTFTPITANSLSGTFASITSPALVSFSPTYSSTSLLLTVSLVPFSSVVETPNQKAIGQALEPVRTNPTGDDATLISNLYTLSQADLLATLDRMSPALFSSLSGLSLSGSNLRTEAVSRRMNMLYDGSTGVFKPFHGEGATDQDTPIANKAAANSDTGFYVDGAGAFAKTKSAADMAGYSLFSTGFFSGADYRLTDNMAAGFIGGYLHGRAASTSNNGYATNDSFHGGVYISRQDGSLFTSVYGGLASDKFKTSRQMEFASMSRTATASPRATEFNFYSSARYDVPSDFGIFSPLAELNYDRVRIGAFTESDAGSLNLSVDEMNSDSMRSNLGIRYFNSYAVEGFNLSTTVTMGWKHEFKGLSDINARLAASGSTPFSTAVGNTGNNAFTAGFGTTANWNTSTTFAFDYLAELRQRLTQHTLTAGMHWKF